MTGRRYGMREMKRIDQLTEYLKGQLATGEMSYAEAVTIDDLISVLEHVRSRVHAALANVRSDDRQLGQKPGNRF